jgi:hypothetical protein
MVLMFRLVAIVAAAVLLTGISAGWSGPAAAIPNPTAPVLTVTIDEPTTVEAVVTEKELGFANFAGTVTMDKLPFERVMVVLTVSVDTEWVAVLSPTTMVFTSNGPQPFTFVVTVPEATSAEEVGHVKVTASASGTGYSVSDDAKANVTVAPYYRIKLEPSTPYQEVPPGNTAVATMVVQNPGNAVDSYTLEIENAKALKDQGWSVELDKTSIAGLRPGGEAQVTITARPSDDWSWDIWTDRPTSIVLKAASQGATTNSTPVYQSAPVFVYQKGLNMPMVNLIIGIITILVISSVIAVIFIRRRRKKRMKAATSGAPESRESGEPENR